MALPNEDPSNPGLPAPLFADVDAVRGDQLRANNQQIWENEEYLDDAITDEAIARAAADSALQSNINAEAAARVAAGTVLQVAYAVTATATTGTTDMFYDDTIPQNTEGDEMLTCAITPKSATSNLLVEAGFFGGEDANVSDTVVIGALFRDSAANAIAACGKSPLTTGEFNSLQADQIILSALVASGATAATTFKLRCGLAGPGAPATFVLNGVNTGRKLGGAMKTWIKITEIAA